MQFILAGFVERYYPSSSIKHRSPAGGGHGGRSSSTGTNSINSSGGGNGGAIHRHRREEESGGDVGKYLAEVLLYLSAFAASNVIWVFFWDFLDRAFRRRKSLSSSPPSFRFLPPLLATIFRVFFPAFQTQTHTRVPTHIHNTTEHLLTANYELSNWLCVLVALPLEFVLNMASTEV